MILQSQYNLVEVTSLTSRWLGSICFQLKEVEISLKLQFLLCVALCGHLQHLDKKTRQKQYAEALEELKGFDVHELLSCNGELVLLSATVQQALMGQLLPDFSQYVDTLNAIINDNANVDADNLYLPRWLLHRLGYASMPPRPKFNWPENLPSLLTATPQELRLLVQQIAAQTDYSTRTIKPPDGLCTILGVCGIHMMKSYNFDLSGALLRCLASLGARESIAINIARKFIYENQNCSGSFGLLDIEFEYLLQLDPSYNPLKLSIPYTLASLWTLAETDIKPYSFYSFGSFLEDV